MVHQLHIVYYVYSFQLNHSNSITIEIIPINIFIETEETNLGEFLKQKRIYPLISQHFIENYSGNIVQNYIDCDIKVHAITSTKKANGENNKWGIYKSFAELNLIVNSCETNQELFQYSLTQIQGGDFNSHKNAGSQAINNLTTTLKNEIFPLMDKSFYQNQ